MKMTLEIKKNVIVDPDLFPNRKECRILLVIIQQIQIYTAASCVALYLNLTFGNFRIFNAV